MDFKVFCAISIELPYRGDSDSDEHIQYAILDIRKEISPYITLNLQLWEPSVFGPLKVYCIYILTSRVGRKILRNRLN